MYRTDPSAEWHNSFANHGEHLHFSLCMAATLVHITQLFIIRSVFEIQNENQSTSL